MNTTKRIPRKGHILIMSIITALLLSMMLGMCAVAQAASVWDGRIPTERPAGFKVDPASRSIRISDAASLAYLCEYDMEEDYQKAWTDTGNQYNDFYYAWGWTVYLETDIDLNNHPWTPIVFGVGSSSRADRKGFDGQGHTISNLKVNASTDGAGLFATIRDISNLTIKNAQVTSTSSSVGVAVGSCSGTAKNVHVSNAKVTGAKYVGGIAGYAYASFIDCSVKNSTITNTGHKDVGGIVGYLCDPKTVTGNIVTNTTIKNTSSNSEQNVGAIVGRWNYPEKTVNGVLQKGILENNKTDSSLYLVDADVNGTMPVQQADPTLPVPQPDPLPPSAITDMPQTGDSSQMALWMSLLILALASVTLINKKRINAHN